MHATRQICLWGFDDFPRDWHQPDYGISDNRKYTHYMNGEIRELLTNYGRIDILWWDSYGRGDLADFWHVGEIFDLVKQLQPEIVMNNRLAELGAYSQHPARWLGDFDTPEQRLGEFQNTRPWESCMSIVTATNGGWSYRPDGQVKPYAECLKSLLSCATGDGNLLLDVGLDTTGIIPEDQAKPLRQVGAWLKKYGESIYSTRGGPYHNSSSGGSTFKGNEIFLHIRQWDGEQVELPPLKARIISFTCLNPNGAPLKIAQNTENVTLTLPVAYQDAINTLVRLTLSGHAAAEMPGGKPLPEIRMHIEKVIKVSKVDDSLVLNASDATIHGDKESVRRNYEPSNVGPQVSQ